MFNRISRTVANIVKHDETTGGKNFGSEGCGFESLAGRQSFTKLCGVVGERVSFRTPPLTRTYLVGPGLDLEELVETRELLDSRVEISRAYDCVAAVDRLGKVSGQLHRHRSWHAGAF